MQWIILKQCERCHLCLKEFVFYLSGKAAGTVADSFHDILTIKAKISILKTKLNQELN